MYRFINFKGFADATLELRTPVTILIGRNGAGKSNVIEGMDIAAGILRGRQLAEIGLPGDVNAAVPVRGGHAECIRKGAQSFAIGLHTGAGAVEYTFEVRRTSGKPIRSTLSVFERGHNGTELQFDTSGESGDSVVTATSPTLGVKSWAHPGNCSILGNGGHVPHLLHDGFALMAERLREGFGTVAVVDPVPARMRMPVREVAGDHVRDCSNVPAALNWLADGTATQKAQFGRIREFVARLLEQSEAKLEVMPFQGTGMVSFKIRLADVDCPATLLSDGTLHAIAVATALEIAPQGAIVCIEDIDRGVHPSQMRHLLDFVAGVAERNKLRVLLTTQNTGLLDAVNDEEMSGVVLCYWDERTKASTLVPLMDLPDAKFFIRSGHLGDAVARELYRSRLDPDFEAKSLAGALERMAESEAAIREARGWK